MLVGHIGSNITEHWQACPIKDSEKDNKNTDSEQFAVIAFDQMIATSNEDVF